MKKRTHQYESPVEPERWNEPDFHSDHDFSFAVVRDPQRISLGDYYQGTEKTALSTCSIRNKEKAK